MNQNKNKLIKHNSNNIIDIRRSLVISKMKAIGKVLENKGAVLSKEDVNKIYSIIDSD